MTLSRGGGRAATSSVGGKAEGACASFGEVRLELPDQLTAGWLAVRGRTARLGKHQAYARSPSIPQPGGQLPWAPVVGRLHRWRSSHLTVDGRPDPGLALGRRALLASPPATWDSSRRSGVYPAGGGHWAGRSGPGVTRWAAGRLDTRAAAGVGAHPLLPAVGFGGSDAPCRGSISPVVLPSCEPHVEYTHTSTTTQQPQSPRLHRHTHQAYRTTASFRNTRYIDARLRYSYSQGKAQIGPSSCMAARGAYRGAPLM